MNEANAPLIRVEGDGSGVVVVLVDAPPRNFLTWAVNEELERVFGECIDENCRVVVVASALPGDWLAHGHLGDLHATLTGQPASGDPRAGGRARALLDTAPFVSIAAIDGQAWGGGAELAWTCDLRVAGRAATFAQPEVRLGLTTNSGSTRLAVIAGEAAARRLALDGSPITAAEAFRTGLVDRLVNPGSALEVARSWGSWLATHPDGALRRIKQIITAARPANFQELLEAEGRSFVDAAMTPGVLERIAGARAAYERGADSYEAFGLARLTNEGTDADR